MAKGEMRSSRSDVGFHFQFRDKDDWKSLWLNCNGEQRRNAVSRFLKEYLTILGPGSYREIHVEIPLDKITIFSSILGLHLTDELKRVLLEYAECKITFQELECELSPIILAKKLKD